MPNFLIDEDTDLLAAEFVLGTLDSEERANAQSLLRTDHGFIAMVRIWERRFGELHLMVEPVEPDAKILRRIRAKIAGIAPSEPAPESKPPAEAMPSPEPPATGLPANAEMPEPVDAATGGEAPQHPDVPADGTMPKPQDVPADAVSAKGEPEKPGEATPAAEPVTPAATEGQPSPEPRSPESVAEPRRPEITINVIRSRGRWRAFGG